MTRTLTFSLIVIFISAGIAQAATVISTNIQTDGTLSVTGTTTTQSIVFANGWSVASSTRGTPSLTISDSANNPVLILDQD